jgi:Alpha/beta hydrolase of unknown function (DUF900)
MLQLKAKNTLMVFAILVGMSTAILCPPIQSYQQSLSSSSSAELILSTRSFFDTSTGFMTPRGQQHSSAVANFQLNEQNCPEDLAIYVHGVWAGEPEAIEQYERIKGSYQLALNSTGQNTQPIPIALYSWDSNTQIDILGIGWDTAKDIADGNGQFLANSVMKLNNDCNSPLRIHIVAHSLGARVVLSALRELSTSPSVLKINSVHLIGAAVDNEEISMNASDTHDSLYDDDVVYGDVIANHVAIFYNLFDPEDDRLQNDREPYEYYPFYEHDTALGSEGAQIDIETPPNYVEMNVMNEIPRNTSIDFADADGNGMCDLEELGYPCQIQSVGDNHRGYIGFRDVNNKRIVDDGVMDIVATDWIAN